MNIEVPGTFLWSVGSKQLLCGLPSGISLLLKRVSNPSLCVWEWSEQRGRGNCEVSKLSLYFLKRHSVYHPNSKTHVNFSQTGILRLPVSCTAFRRGQSQAQPWEGRYAQTLWWALTGGPSIPTLSHQVQACTPEMSCGSYSEGSGFHNAGAHQGSHLCVEEKQLFTVWYASLPLGKRAPGYRHCDSFWALTWRWVSSTGRWAMCWRMGEPHLPLQAWDSLTWAHHHPKRGKGSVVPSIHGPRVAKYLTLIFGGPYVQNYLYTVCPTEMEGGG